jgi:hypothetical protein
MRTATKPRHDDDDPELQENRRQKAERVRRDQEQRHNGPNGSAGPGKGPREQYQDQAAAGRKPAPYPYTLLSDIKPNFTNRDIIRDLLPKLSFGEVHADSSGGKTTLLIDMLLHVAADMPYRDRRTEHQIIVYVALEGQGGIDNRVAAAKEHLGLAGKDIPFALVKVSANFREANEARRIADTVADLRAKFPNVGDCPIVVIDTLTAALAGGSDSDPKDVGAFITNVYAHLMPRCTLIVAHHFGKDRSRGSRGWSGLNCALDFELEITREGQLRTMRVSKARDGRDDQPAMSFRFVERMLGVNNLGEPVTSIVVLHLADAAAEPGRRVALSKSARKALEQLWVCVHDPARRLPMSGDLAGLHAVLLGTWEAACLPYGVISEAAGERDRRKIFNRAKDELFEGKSVICDGPTGQRVYPAPKAARDGREDGGL